MLNRLGAVFHPEAAMEHTESVAHYRSIRSKLGQDFVIEFNEQLQLVVTYPDRYKVLLEPNIRKLSLDKFPYNIIYRQTPNGIQVLAVAHQSRRPNYWHNRIQAS